MNHDQSHTLFQQARQLMPGGVNSPVRAFKSVGGEPFFAKRAEGAYLIDVDGNRYIDYIGSWGPMIAGHAHPAVIAAVDKVMRDGLSFGVPNALEVTMAQAITRLVPSCEMVRMVNSGTEATLSAIRLARGATGRNRIVKFEGCYHGHGDSFLVKAGSGMLTLGVPNSPGVPKSLADLTLTLSYNDIEGATRLFAELGEDIAGVIVEPIVGNANCILPAEGYLQHLRDLCTQYGSLLIFDEVMTGFRVALGGAQALYGITPDLTTFGKIIGGGMPVGAYGGRRDLLRRYCIGGDEVAEGLLQTLRWRRQRLDELQRAQRIVCRARLGCCLRFLLGLDDDADFVRVGVGRLFDRNGPRLGRSGRALVCLGGLLDDNGLLLLCLANRAERGLEVLDDVVPLARVELQVEVSSCAPVLELNRLLVYLLRE